MHTHNWYIETTDDKALKIMKDYSDRNNITLTLHHITCADKTRRELWEVPFSLTLVLYNTKGLEFKVFTKCNKGKVHPHKKPKKRKRKR